MGVSLCVHTEHETAVLVSVRVALDRPVTPLGEEGSSLEPLSKRSTGILQRGRILHQTFL